ncbi:MAG: hypothetical protein ACFB21_08595 [Opitutales bacterium]
MKEIAGKMPYFTDSKPDFCAFYIMWPEKSRDEAKHSLTGRFLV